MPSQRRTPTPGSATRTGKRSQAPATPRNETQNPLPGDRERPPQPQALTAVADDDNALPQDSPSQVSLSTWLRPGALVLVKDPDHVSATVGRGATTSSSRGRAPGGMARGEGIEERTAAAAVAAGNATAGDTETCAWSGWRFAVITGFSTRRGLVSLCFGLEPVVDDVSVPMTSVLPCTSTRAYNALVEADKRVCDEATAAAAAKKNRASPADATAAGQPVAAPWSIMPVASGSAQGGSRHDPNWMWHAAVGGEATATPGSSRRLVVCDTSCGGLSGLPLLTAAVRCAASTNAIDPQPVSVVIVVSQPTALMHLQETVDAVSDAFSQGKCAAENTVAGSDPISAAPTALRHLRTPCALRFLVSGEEPSRNSRERTSVSMQSVALSEVYCCVGADLFHMLGCSDSSSTKVKAEQQHLQQQGQLPLRERLPKLFSDGPVVIMPGESKDFARLVIAELEAAWVADGRELAHVECPPMPAPEDVPCVRLMVPCSLQQVRCVALAAAEWSASVGQALDADVIANLTIGSAGASAIAPVVPASATATSPTKRGRLAFVQVSDVIAADARVYALRRIGVYESRSAHERQSEAATANPNGPLPGICVRTVLVVPHSFYGDEIVAQALGGLVYAVDASTDRRDFAAIASAWHTSLCGGVLLLRLPLDAPSEVAGHQQHHGVGSPVTMKKQLLPAAMGLFSVGLQPLLAASVCPHAHAFVTVGDAAEGVVRQWLAAWCGAMPSAGGIRQAKRLPTWYSICTDLEVVLRSLTATEAMKQEGQERKRGKAVATAAKNDASFGASGSVTPNAILNARLGRIWDANAVTCTSVALHEEHAEVKRSKRGATTGMRTAPRQPVGDAAETGSAPGQSSGMPFDPLPGEHPIERDVRVASAASAIPPTQLQRLSATSRLTDGDDEDDGLI